MCGSYRSLSTFACLARSSVKRWGSGGMVIAVYGDPPTPPPKIDRLHVDGANPPAPPAAQIDGVEPPAPPAAQVLILPPVSPPLGGTIPFLPSLASSMVFATSNTQLSTATTTSPPPRRRGTAPGTIPGTPIAGLERPTCSAAAKFTVSPTPQLTNATPLLPPTPFLLLTPPATTTNVTSHEPLLRTSRKKTARKVVRHTPKKKQKRKKRLKKKKLERETKSTVLASNVAA